MVPISKTCRDTQKTLGCRILVGKQSRSDDERYMIRDLVEGRFGSEISSVSTVQLQCTTVPERNTSRSCRTGDCKWYSAIEGHYYSLLPPRFMLHRSCHGRNKVCVLLIVRLQSKINYWGYRYTTMYIHKIQGKKNVFISTLNVRTLRYNQIQELVANAKLFKQDICKIYLYPRTSLYSQKYSIHIIKLRISKYIL